MMLNFQRVLSAGFQLTRQILIVKECALLIHYHLYIPVPLEDACFRKSEWVYELKMQQFTRTETENIDRLV